MGAGGGGGVDVARPDDAAIAAVISSFSCGLSRAKPGLNPDRFFFFLPSSDADAGTGELE